MLTWAWHSAVIAVTGLAGSAWVLAGVSAPVARQWHRRVLTAATIAAAALVLAVLARLWLQTFEAFGGDEPLSWLLVRVIVTETRWGWGWTWQALGAGLCLVTALMARRNTAHWPLLLASAVATAFATSVTGHAVGMDDHVWITVVAQGTHVIAAGLWIGTLGGLLMVTYDAGEEEPDTEAFADAFTRFSRLAQPAVALLVAGGLVATWRHVGAVSNLATPYGVVLGLKVAAFVGAALCGLYNWRVLGPRLRTQPRAAAALSRVALVEVTLGAIAIALTSIIGTLPMPGHDH